MMLKILAIAFFAAAAYPGAAYAHGGAEPMPQTNFTDLPDYRPKPPPPCQRGKHVCDRARWHQGVSRSN
jgi:hypothetical protein